MAHSRIDYYQVSPEAVKAMMGLERFVCKRPWLIILAIILFCILLLPGCAKHNSPSEELRVGVPGDYAPLAFYDQSGQLIGFDIDIAKSLGDWLNRKVVFIPTSWPALSDDLLANKFDIAMGGITYTAKRNKLFALSNPVLENGKVALIHCDQAGKYTTLEEIDRPNVQVVVNRGGTNQSFADAHIRQAHIIYTKNNSENFQYVCDHLADVLITDLIEAKYYHNKEPQVLCVANQHVFTGTASYKVYMMLKTKPDLLAQVNNYLATNSKHRLAQQWNLPE